MNKHTAIVIGASIIIAGVVGFGLWSVFAVGQIQFKVANQDNFRFFGLINEKKISFCNPTPFYSTFNNFKIQITFEGREIGELVFPGAVLEPNSETIREGQLTTTVFEEVQYLSMHFDGMLLDAIPERIDHRKMVINTESQVQIIGIIPVSVSEQYSAVEFWQMMNSDEHYLC